MIVSRFRTLLASLSVTFMTGCSQLPDSPEKLSSEEYKVYSAFLDDFTVTNEEQIIVYDSTTLNSHDIHPDTNWGWVTVNLGDKCRYEKDTSSCRKAHDPTWASLFAVIKQAPYQRPLPIKNNFNTRNYPLSVFSRLSLSKLSESDDQSRRYIFGFSPVAYNKDKTKALFFSSFYCGGTCGRGELIMLEKVNQTWSLIDRFRFWIA